jgi:hypothetical protein
MRHPDEAHVTPEHACTRLSLVQWINEISYFV